MGITKRIYLSLIAAIAAILYTTGAIAEPTQGAKAVIRYNEFMVEHITSALKLEGAKRERFGEIYVAMINDNRAARNRSGQMKIEIEDLDRYTNAETEAIVMSAYDLSIELIEIKKRYYGYFCELLTPREIVMMYDIERRGREIFSAELKRRKATK